MRNASCMMSVTVDQLQLGQVDDFMAVDQASESWELELEFRTAPILGGKVIDVQGRLKRYLKFWSVT